MKLGGEPRKVVILAGLTVVAGYLFYTNWSSGSTPPRASEPRQASSETPAPPESTPAPQRAATRSAPRRTAQLFRPTLRPRRPEDRPDPMQVDPTLRLDLLAKLQEIEAGSGGRSLFDFGAPPPPERPEPKIVPKPMEAPKPDAAGSAEKREPPKPPPPPVPLKYYGYINSSDSADRRAFFINGEDIYVAGEGELIEKRYKIVRVGITSAVVEDTEHENRQTLALVAEQQR